MSEKKAELSSQKVTEPAKPQFDSDLLPSNPQNRDAGRAHGLHYDKRQGFWKDCSGCLVLDRFGQPL